MPRGSPVLKLTGVRVSSTSGRVMERLRRFHASQIATDVGSLGSKAGANRSNSLGIRH